ncbi:unnamed protein product [Amoebophrya sp. A25]|nr:unnamed protein product [Amoebophrya sp. A25]|eukprot:GSA25T00026739001.1
MSSLRSKMSLLRLVSVLNFTAASVFVAAAPPCTQPCEDQFVKCVTVDNFSYTFCSGEITGGNPNNPMGRAGCVATCTFTATMLSHQGSSGSGGGSGGGSSCTAGPVVSAGGTKVAATTQCYVIGGRNVQVSVPSGSSGTTAFPLLFLFHGNGGTGNGMIRIFTSAATQGATKINNAYILVAPDGESKSWNIVAEASNQDDVAFVTQTLLNYFSTTFSNANAAHAEMLGLSNGAALINRILIESNEPRILGAVTGVSQLNTHQYKNGNFYLGGSPNTYTTVQPNLYKRRLMQITGAQDVVIPAGGGQSTIPAGSNGEKLQMLTWEESLFRYAVAYGYTGTQKSASVTSGTNSYKSTSYTTDGVTVHGYNYDSKGHANAVDLNDAVQADFLAEFLLATTTTRGVTASPSSGAPSQNTQSAGYASSAFGKGQSMTAFGRLCTLVAGGWAVVFFSLRL